MEWRRGIYGFTGAPGPPLFLLASPRPSHWSAQSWAAHHLKKQTALHHHQHQGATTKHTATPHDPTHSTGRRGLDRPELNCLLRPSGVPACCGVRADIRSDLGWVSLLSRIVLVAARASWLILVRQDRDRRPFPSVLLDCFSRRPESCVV